MGSDLRDAGVYPFKLEFPPATPSVNTIVAGPDGASEEPRGLISYKIVTYLCADPLFPLHEYIYAVLVPGYKGHFVCFLFV